MTVEPILFTSRQQFIDELKARRSWVRDVDRRALEEHKAEEKKAVEAFRARCRQLAKLPQTELVRLSEDSRRSYRDGPRAEFDRPSCPVSQEAALDRILAVLALSHQEKFTVDAHGNSAWSTAHRLLTADENQKETLC